MNRQVTVELSFEQFQLLEAEARKVGLEVSELIQRRMDAGLMGGRLKGDTVLTAAQVGH